MVFGLGTNNHEKLLAVKIVILFAKEKEIKAIQIFRDSMLVICWIRKNHNCYNLMLLPLLEEVLNITTTFESFSLQHVYRECNDATDCLSKTGLQLANMVISVK
jgi:ribonuclease HI